MVLWIHAVTEVPRRVTADTASSQARATSVSTVWSCWYCGATSSSVALAAGRVAEAMKSTEVTSTDQPERNPMVGPKMRLTQMKLAPALASSRFRRLKARAIPSMVRPQYSTIAGANRPVAAISIAGARGYAERRRGACHAHHHRMHQAERALIKASGMGHGAAKRASVQSNAVRLRCQHRVLGKRTVKQLPLPASLSIASVAWWRASACFTIASPRPVPPVSRERPRSTR